MLMLSFGEPLHILSQLQYQSRLLSGGSLQLFAQLGERLLLLVEARLDRTLVTLRLRLQAQALRHAQHQRRGEGAIGRGHAHHTLARAFFRPNAARRRDPKLGAWYSRTRDRGRDGPTHSDKVVVRGQRRGLSRRIRRHGRARAVAACSRAAPTHQQQSKKPTGWGQHYRQQPAEQPAQQLRAADKPARVAAG